MLCLLVCFQAGAELEAANSAGLTCLMASVGNHLTVTALLRSAGQRAAKLVLQEDCQGNTALHFAARAGELLRIELKRVA